MTIHQKASWAAFWHACRAYETKRYDSFQMFFNLAHAICPSRDRAWNVADVGKWDRRSLDF